MHYRITLFLPWTFFSASIWLWCLMYIFFFLVSQDCLFMMFNSYRGLSVLLVKVTHIQRLGLLSKSSREAVLMKVWREAQTAPGTDSISVSSWKGLSSPSNSDSYFPSLPFPGAFPSNSTYYVISRGHFRYWLSVGPGDFWGVVLGYMFQANLSI